jgi:hypothetical protein
MFLHVNAYQQVQHVCTQMAFFEAKVSWAESHRCAVPFSLYSPALDRF